ncbi:MAG: hypothetical protein ACR2JY_03495 [Chloroflexota bacterium]
MNRVIATIWSGMLIATGLAVVPLVVNLLQRTWQAARNIERYTAEILQSGVGIANNTANIAALKTTLSVAPQLVTGATSIQGHVTTIETALGGSGAAGKEGTA